MLAGTWFKNISDPAREVIECGVQLARGFPPRSKWTYGEVFHPAVVPQPPFSSNLTIHSIWQFIQFGIEKKQKQKQKLKIDHFNK